MWRNNCLLVYEERILIGTPFGSAVYSEGASGSEKASGLEKVSYSHGSIALATSVHFFSSDEADNEDSTLAPFTDVPSLVDDQPNQWCV